jgi:diaminopimelate decarboxylase
VTRDDHEATAVLRISAAVPLAAGVWPHTASQAPDGEISIGGLQLSELAETYGTPAYILDEADVRHRCRAYHAAFPGAEVVYAGKAFLCRAMAQWIAREGLSLGVCSAGELAVAAAVGFPAGRIILHGHAKSPEDLHAAFRYGVGRIAADSVAEITRLVAQAPHGQQVLVRVTPGTDSRAHQGGAPGADDQKFGFSLGSGAAADAVRRVLDHPELRLVGLHCHIGSQLTDLAAYEAAARALIGLMAAVLDTTGVALPELNLGGGHAIPCVVGYEDFDLDGFARRIRQVITAECARRRMPVPRLVIEHGPAIVGRAAVTLYRVLGVKRAPGGRAFVAVDGGMSDNPRPAACGSGYPVRALRPSTAPDHTVTVVGRHCEAGEVIAADVPLPEDVRPGDVLAVPGTGAYNHSMASNCNMVGRPPVIAVRDGAARVLVRRETASDLLSRDVGL